MAQRALRWLTGVTLALALMVSQMLMDATPTVYSADPTPTPTPTQTTNNPGGSGGGGGI